MSLNKKQYYIVFLSFIILYVAQAFSQDTFEEWQKQQQNEFKEFVDNEDREFLSFLKLEWKKIDPKKGKAVQPRPKPKIIPTVIKSPEDTEQEDIEAPLSKNIIELPPIEKKKPIEKVPVSKPDAQKKYFSFYNVQTEWANETAIRFSNQNSINKNNIVQFWENLSKQNLKKIVEQSIEIKQKMHLNDWGYALLLNEIGKQVLDVPDNQRNLFVWALLIKSGYNVKIGYNASHTFLLTASYSGLFQVPYLIQNSKKLYIFSFQHKVSLPKGIFTYSQNHSLAEKMIDFKVAVSPVISAKFSKREIEFKYRNNSHLISFYYNKSAVDFFKDYPQIELKLYFQAQLTAKTHTSLLLALHPLVKNKTESEAVNIILHFVQRSTAYKTDQEQFGREKYLFAEESLFYPYSDCEDRSILFAYLVRNLLGMDVIGLDYPSHIATAVKFSSEVSGDSILFNEKNYLICDPTYIGADIGMNMPDNKKIKPKIIEL